MQGADKLLPSFGIAIRPTFPRNGRTNSMTRRVFASIARALRTKPTLDGVHFHIHSDGQPFVCDVDRCESPTLSAGEIDRARR
jgi:hypothetical protein